MVSRWDRHYIVMMEGSRIEWTNLAGGSPALQSVYNFFSPLGATATNSLNHPRCVYDSINQRYIVIMGQQRVRPHHQQRRHCRVQGLQSQRWLVLRFAEHVDHDQWSVDRGRQPDAVGQWHEHLHHRVPVQRQRLGLRRNGMLGHR